MSVPDRRDRTPERSGFWTRFAIPSCAGVVLLGSMLGIMGGGSRVAGGSRLVQAVTLAGLAGLAGAFSPVTAAGWSSVSSDGRRLKGGSPANRDQTAAAAGASAGPEDSSSSSERRQKKAPQSPRPKTPWDKRSPSSREMPLFFPETIAADRPERVVHCAEAVAWLTEQPALRGSLFTSLPDICELSLEGKEDQYKEWFISTARLAMEKLKPGAHAIFYQSDIKVRPKQRSHGGGECFEWLDKSYLISKAAEQAGCTLMWRKIVCKSKTDTHNIGAPAFTHMLCFGKDTGNPSDLTYDARYFNCPDIIPRGMMLWPKAIGVDAAVLGVRFLRDLCKTERIVDPFCGVGTVLAVANALGVAAEGGDLSPQKADRASRLTLDEYLFGEREYEWGNYDDSASRGGMGKLSKPKGAPGK